MSEKHLIALDLDGTLLTDKKDISPFSKQMLTEAIAEGHIVVIATGRSHRTSILYYRTLGLDTAIVNFNGAYIHHPNNNKWDTLHHPVDRKNALEIIDTCHQLNVNNIIVEVQDQVFMDQNDENLLKIYHSLKTDKEFMPVNIGHIKEKLTIDPTSMLILPEEKNISSLKGFLSDQYGDSLDHRTWGDPNQVVEISRKGINKAVGLKKLAEIYNIPKKRIIAFGDENNDLEMIDYAGVGVAMGNAIPELKSIAKHLTKTNEEDGVALFLEDYLNLKVKVS